MKEELIDFGGTEVKVISLNTVIIGTGAAGYNAADRLHQYGQKDIAIVTEGVEFGTSRNAGSDKQTYYKLSLAGSNPDSVRRLAQTLFDGGCVDGDIALCEAALSAQSFFRLVELGVQFPCNRYGEYAGYKTDHDPAERATSIGPLTSRSMTECLQTSAEAKGIRIYGNLLAVKLIKKNDRAVGLICADCGPEKQGSPELVVFNCCNVVFASGGPAGIYSNSAYPENQFGAHAVAFEAGVAGRNLTEWQYGLASINPRWNVSGTYMQALPRFVSTDHDGGDEREFLSDYLNDTGELLSKVFLKGYQWPFDVRKTRGGSSLIDLFVYVETVMKGRRVFLDYRSNPGGGAIDFNKLDAEARTYLEKAGACFGKPIERLAHMNAPAVEFYKNRGVDLCVDMLEIALCAQHNNGGLGVDCWWRTNIEGVFAAGEAAATHGVFRPGGSALNAGQVGSMRAARYIAMRRTDTPLETTEFVQCAESDISEIKDLRDHILSGGDNVFGLFEAAAKRMSRAGGAVRDVSTINAAISEITGDLSDFSKRVRGEGKAGFITALKLKNILLSQYIYLKAMVDYADKYGESRGSALYLDPRGETPHPALDKKFSFRCVESSSSKMVQEVIFTNGSCAFNWREVRPIPDEEDFFENVWRGYREDGNVR